MKKYASENLKILQVHTPTLLLATAKVSVELEFSCKYLCNNFVVKIIPPAKRAPTPTKIPYPAPWPNNSTDWEAEDIFLAMCISSSKIWNINQVLKSTV